MAEPEDEGAKTDQPGKSSATSKDAPSSEIASSEAPAKTTPHAGESIIGGPKSEWTASDARGPLAAADERAARLGTADPPEPLAEPLSQTAPSDPEPAPLGTTARRAADATNTVSPSPSGSRWPIVAGILAGAAVGAVVAVLVDRNESRPPSAELTSLAAKVDALEARKPAEPDLGPIRAALSTLQSQVADVRKSAAGADTSQLEQKIAALQSQGAAAKDADAKLGQMQGTLDALKQQMSATAADMQALKEQQKGLADRIGAPALAIVADSLVQAIEAGQPYTKQVEALQALGADPAQVGILSQTAANGVASPRVLAAKLAPLEEPILATAHKPPSDASFMQKLESGMSSLVSIRRTGDTGGTDTSSLLARIETALAHDDLGDAAKAWDALPADARAKSEAWSALLKQSAAALGAARNLQTNAIVALAGKKS